MTDNSEARPPAPPSLAAPDQAEGAGVLGPLTTIERIGALAVRMGIRIEQASPEHLVGTMPVEGNTQPFGLLHGGASAVLAETLGSVGAYLAAGPGRVAVGIELTISHHAAARTGIVRGEANALSIGKTLASYDIAIYGEDEGRRLATARLTCLLRSAPSLGE